MSLIGNSVAPYRFRFSRRAREQSGVREQAQPWTNMGADPRSRTRCGSFLASDGAAVPYRLWHARESAAAVLLLHGAFDYAAAFDEIGPKLACKGLSALAIDQRGFGATGSRGLWSGTARMTQDACEAAEFLLGRVGTDKPLFVLGESMGGAVAIHAAAADSIPRLRGIVLAAPGALASRFRHRLLAWIAAAARFLAGDSELIFERLSGWELTPAAAIRLIGDPLVMRRMRPDMLCGMADLALSAVDAAGSVQVPALTMVGARDEFVRLACVRRLFDNLAGEKLWRVIPDAPHLMLHWRRSNEILREAVNWMTAQAVRPVDDRKTETPAIAGNARSAGARLD
jgi:alpha-beta hydrolase superfamily lysophospholipase